MPPQGRQNPISTGSQQPPPDPQRELPRPPGPSSEKLNALQKTIDTLEEKGMQADQRYSLILALGARTAQVQASAVFTSFQMNQLRNQIMAYM
ncbi:ATP-dependent helicase brm-like [Euwallacea similis]|uniref:ATP-dependent helicase brm-like n=1 Tax=Euwallacea similis TaxID=1736056 RepID=UPI00344BFB2F